MKRRANKRRISARYRLRGKTIWLTAEERAWENMVPIISPDSPEVLKRLHARFPYMYEGENIGLSISRGWMLMFAKLCEDIDALLGADKQGFHWIQIKEKFGSARFYWSMEGGRQAVRVNEIDKLGDVTTLVERHLEDSSNPTLQEQISALVDAASDKTQHMCIVCGQPGKGHSDRDYVLILCDEHIRQREAGIEPVF